MNLTSKVKKLTTEVIIIPVLVVKLTSKVFHFFFVIIEVVPLISKVIMLTSKVYNINFEVNL